MSLGSQRSLGFDIFYHASCDARVVESKKIVYIKHFDASTLQHAWPIGFLGPDVLSAHLNTVAARAK